MAALSIMNNVEAIELEKKTEKVNISKINISLYKILKKKRCQKQLK